MPVLQAESELYPEDLFGADNQPNLSGRVWWVLHTKPRQEKSLARDLVAQQLPFYLPVVGQRSLVRGRVLTSHIPLFPGYLFLLAEGNERIEALTTHRVVRSIPVTDQTELWRDLRQVQRLIATGAPLTAEGRLAPGMEVEIQSGPLAGLRGKILRSATGKRFVVSVNFIQQGASVLLDDFVLLRVKKDPA